MPEPQVTINLDIIERNARTVVSTCQQSGITVFGVTKGTCGMPQVARAMLRGGVAGIGESRFENIRRLRNSGIDCPILLLRSPPSSLLQELLLSVDISLHSELSVIAELSRMAEYMGQVHDIILMVDLGDLREGIWPDELEATVEQVLTMPGVRIVGLGTNLTCFGAILPTAENMNTLLAHAHQLEQQYGLQLSYISGGNSGSLPLLLSGNMPAGINNLRIGEAILQGGRDTFFDQPWEALDRGAFILEGELIEAKIKPSVPIGQMGVDAFGKRPIFKDRGNRLRGIVNIGREDIIVEGLMPIEPGVEVLGASSDHLVLDITAMQPPPKVGNVLGFTMDYGALLAAMTSEYVVKNPLFDQAREKKVPKVSLVVQPELKAVIANVDLINRFADIDMPAKITVNTDGFHAATKAFKHQHTLLLIGTDPNICLSGMRAMAQYVDSFGLLWFDATASFDRGSVLYQALGYDPTAIALKPQLAPENVVLIGLREVGREEAKLIKASGVNVFTIEDIDMISIRVTMIHALRAALAGTRGFYVSYNPAVTDMPGSLVGSGGLTLRETHQAMEAIARSRDMLAMGVAGLEPIQEARVHSNTLAFVMSCFGKRIL